MNEETPKAQLPSPLPHTFGTFANIQLDGIQKYANTLDQFLEDEAEALHTKSQETIERASGRLKDEIADMRAYEARQMEEEFPNRLRKSVLVSLYSLLEDELNKICQLFDKHSKHAVELDDIAGGGIRRAKKYLEKVAGVDFPTQSPHWGDIVSFNRIRNCIVHYQGNMRRADNTKLNNYVSNHSKLGTDENGRLEISHQFIKEAIETVRTLFDELSSTLQQDHSGGSWTKADKA